MTTPALLRLALGAVAALGLALGTARAQSFTLTVTPADTVRQGDYVSLVFTFEDVSAASFRMPAVEGLVPAGGPSRRSQVSIVNGVRSSSEALVYRYVADRAGEATIPAVALDAAAGALQTEPQTLYVRADPDYASRLHLDPSAPPPAAPPTPDRPRRPVIRM